MVTNTVPEGNPAEIETTFARFIATPGPVVVYAASVMGVPAIVVSRGLTRGLEKTARLAIPLLLAMLGMTVVAVLWFLMPVPVALSQGPWSHLRVFGLTLCDALDALVGLYLVPNRAPPSRVFCRRGLVVGVVSERDEHRVGTYQGNGCVETIHPAPCSRGGHSCVPRRCRAAITS